LQTSICSVHLFKQPLAILGRQYTHKHSWATLWGYKSMNLKKELNILVTKCILDLHSPYVCSSCGYHAFGVQYYLQQLQWLSTFVSDKIVDIETR
jgi:hypothetical protein